MNSRRRSWGPDPPVNSKEYKCVARWKEGEEHPLRDLWTAQEVPAEWSDLLEKMTDAQLKRAYLEAQAAKHSKQT